MLRRRGWSKFGGSRSAGTSVAEHKVAERGSRIGLHTGENVLVDGHGERRAAVAEAFADDLHRDVRLQQDRGVGVAEIVEADAVIALTEIPQVCSSNFLTL